MGQSSVKDEARGGGEGAGRGQVKTIAYQTEEMTLSRGDKYPPTVLHKSQLL